MYMKKFLSVIITIIILFGCSGKAYEVVEETFEDGTPKTVKYYKDETKEKLLKEMWEKLDTEDKKQLKKEFDIDDVSAFIHGSELMVVHVVGVYLARETALFAAAAVCHQRIHAQSSLGTVGDLGTAPGDPAMGGTTDLAAGHPHLAARPGALSRADHRCGAPDLRIL